MPRPPLPRQPVDRWSCWLRELDKIAVQDHVDVLCEPADGLATAGYAALATAVQPPPTLSDAAWRFFRAAGVTGYSVDDVLDKRPT